MGTGTASGAATASKLVQSSYLVSAYLHDHSHPLNLPHSHPPSQWAIVSLHLTLQLWTMVTLWEFVAMQGNCCDQEKEKLFKQRKLLKIIADPEGRYRAAPRPLP